MNGTKLRAIASDENPEKFCRTWDLANNQRDILRKDLEGLANIFSNLTWEER